MFIRFFSLLQQSQIAGYASFFGGMAEVELVVGVVLVFAAVLGAIGILVSIIRLFTTNTTASPPGLLFLMMGLLSVVAPFAVHYVLHRMKEVVRTPGLVEGGASAVAGPFMTAAPFVIGAACVVALGVIAFSFIPFSSRAGRKASPLVCLMLVVTIFLVERDFRSRLLMIALGATAATLATGLVYAFAIESITGSTVAEGGGNLLLRLRFLRFDDWTRFAYLIVPGGVVPAIALVNWRRFDLQARVMTLVAIAYFVFFYCLAFISLHHFAPAMLLPLVVLWRREGQRETRTPPALRLVVAAGLVVAVLAALPRSMTPYRANREVAKSIAFDAGNVSGYALIRNTFDASRALDSLFTPYFGVSDPEVDRVGDPLSLAWYAQLARPSRDSALYVVQPEALAPPSGTTPLGTARGFALYTRDPGARERLRHAPPPHDARSPLYDVPRTTLFQHLGREAGVVQVDMRDVACSVLRGVGPCGRGDAHRGPD